MQGHRDELVLTTKGFNPTGPDRNARGLSRRHIMRAVEDSLRRLKTDRVDVYFLHQLRRRDAARRDAARAGRSRARRARSSIPALSN